ncbi:MAG: hypothetical protein U5P41_08040 [Gammaproteobacteria bacterium]|nr:hypothetical protein [Gammaproteobacteria bacterium]
MRFHERAIRPQDTMFDPKPEAIAGWFISAAACSRPGQPARAANRSI